MVRLEAHVDERQGSILQPRCHMQKHLHATEETHCTGRTTHADRLLCMAAGTVVGKLMPLLSYCRNFEPCSAVYDASMALHSPE